MFRNGGRADAILALLPIAYYNIQSTIQTGGKVSQWNDLSGNGRHAVQATAGNQMTVNATGTAAYSGKYDVSIPFDSRSFTMHLLFRRKSYNRVPTGFVFNVPTSKGGIYIQDTFGTVSVYGRSVTDKLGVLFDYDLMPVTFCFGAGALDIYIGGVRIFTGAANTANTGTITSLFEAQTAGQPVMGGEVAQCAMWSRALTSAEVLALHTGTGTLAVGKNVVLCVGDSISVGYKATDYAQSWRKKVADANGIVIGIIGGAGRMVSQTYSQRTNVSFTTYNRYVFFMGTNDLVNGQTFAQLRDNAILLLQYIKAQNAAAKILLVTMLPRGNGTTTPTASFESDRQLYNQWLRDNVGTYADGIVDPGADATIGEAGDSLNTTYYEGDGIHPIDAGHTILAGYIAAGLAAMG